eukprot:Protomagalhaensia_sp_Gyna_25__1227@NODE_1610_length_1691_cov_7_877724_g1316_i0_p1_GENE_NODE_1610_length_1691_cov_7_877724_g1316_i0NODE_1610_length_1691_cov_7_877724_g1316_i0_p1_ORF_typecomplete_len374_score43_06PrsWprotease/PF13367_6/4_9e27DUF3341/PF11821_8/0_14MASE5/PF17178_4/0_058MASE5/PF17178_4/1_1e03_NODE_1610_length_1691_cov_7_877724_g1316_i05231644
MNETRRYGRSPHIKGADWAVSLTLTLTVLAAVCYLFSDGIAGPFLLYLAILPICLVLCLLRYKHEKDISVPLMCEMIVCGGILGIGVAIILEWTGQRITMPIWKCQKSPIFTWQCDAIFSIVVTICVGLSEEFAKFFPLCRLRRRIQYMPYVSTGVWYRLVETPYGLALAGCASAAGFAGIENAKYILTTGRKDIQHGIHTSLFRAILAIPFHVACTGWLAGRLSREWFFRVGDEITERQAPTRSLFEQLREWCGGEPPLLDDEYHAVGNPHMLYKGVSLWRYLKLMMVPVLLHGIYDTGLFLATQFMAVSNVADKMEASSTIQLYQQLAATAVSVSLISYATMITLFYREFFIDLREFQAHAVPRLHHNFDC